MWYQAKKRPFVFASSPSSFSASSVCAGLVTFSSVVLDFLRPGTISQTSKPWSKPARERVLLSLSSPKYQCACALIVRTPAFWRSAGEKLSSGAAIVNKDALRVSSLGGRPGRDAPRRRRLLRL